MRRQAKNVRVYFRESLPVILLRRGCWIAYKSARLAGGTSMNVEKRRELTVLLFLTMVVAPLLAVIVVAGYGFLVWMYQLIAGPPHV